MYYKPGAVKCSVDLFHAGSVLLAGQRLLIAKETGEPFDVILIADGTDTCDADVCVTADALKGTKSIQVANGGAYVVGDVITIDKVDGAAQANGMATINGGYLFFFDGIYFKRQPGFTWYGPSTGAPPVNASDFASANTAARNAVPQWRSTMQLNEIVAINGDRVANTRDADRLINRNSGYWEITISRGGRTFTTVLGR